MSRQRFRELVAEALDGIPERFARCLENVEVVVEDEPDDELLLEMGMDPEYDTLFGLYQGTPLTERHEAMVAALPDRISIYYLPLVEELPDPDELREEIRRTVVHEIAHFFGMEEDEVEAEGY